MDKRKKVILIYNPKSGAGIFSSYLDRIIERYQDAGYLLIPVRASGENGIDRCFSEIDKETYKEEYHQILAAGGDGTLNVCVNAMMKYGIDLPLGIFAAGTANDYAYALGIPDDIEGMIDAALSGKYTRADLGIINDRYFINVAAIGQVVDVSQKTDPDLKNSIGVLAYYLKGLSEVPNLKPVRVVLTTEENVYKEKMYFMVVMNGKSAGGFKRISPGSEVNDGLFDVLLFRDMKVMEMPSLLIKFLQGRHPENRNVLHFQTSKLKLEAEVDLPTDIDGELGEKLPLNFELLPGKLKICTLENDMGSDEVDRIEKNRKIRKRKPSTNTEKDFFKKIGVEIKSKK